MNLRRMKAIVFKTLSVEPCRRHRNGSSLKTTTAGKPSINFQLGNKPKRTREREGGGGEQRRCETWTFETWMT